MAMNRRQFLGTSALAAGSLMSGSALAAPKDDKMIWSYLIHLGMNSWKDIPLDRAPKDASRSFKVRCMADYLRTDEAVWRTVTDRMVKVGMNMVIIDLGEAIQYPSHPERG